MRNPRARAEALIRSEQERLPHLLIGGLEVSSEAHGTAAVLDPATGRTLARCPAASARDVERAVESARRTFDDGWPTTAPRERAELLWRLSDRLAEAADDLALLECLQTGRTLREVRTGDLAASVDVLRAHAGLARDIAGETFALGGGALGLTRWLPHPVMAAVLPAAEPLAAAVRKVAVAVALGSSLVLKAPEGAPLAVLALGRLLGEVGLPPGAVNVLTGGHATAGEALALSPGVQDLSFAGPVDAARRALLGAAKSNLKAVHLELGGKTAAVVFEDADLGAAAEAVARSIFTSRCVGREACARLLVERSVYQELATTLAIRAREAIVGDPLDEDTELGPLPSEEQLRRALSYVELGRREGARLVAGGTRDAEGLRASGAFMRPTVLVDGRPAMRVAREDVGGPVLTVVPFDGEREALAAAAEAELPLSASVWTRDADRAHRVAERLDAGTVWINGHGALDPLLPRSGRGLAGQGADLGRVALLRHAQVKSIHLPRR